MIKLCLHYGSLIWILLLFSPAAKNYASGRSNHIMDARNSFQPVQVICLTSEITRVGPSHGAGEFTGGEYNLFPQNRVERGGRRGGGRYLSVRERIRPTPSVQLAGNGKHSFNHFMLPNSRATSGYDVSVKSNHKQIWPARAHSISTLLLVLKAPCSWCQNWEYETLFVSFFF